MDNVTNKQVTELQSALLRAREEVEALKTASKYSEKPVVVVRHTGHGPQLVIKASDGDDVVLNPRGDRSIATVSLFDINRVKRNTNWFEMGYLYIDGQLEENPNIVLDIEEWVTTRTESEILEDVKEITSLATLNHMYNYTEGKERTSKMLSLRDACARRIEQLAAITVVEDPVD
jgi:hypothetical protein